VNISNKFVTIFRDEDDEDQPASTVRVTTTTTQATPRRRIPEPTQQKTVQNKKQSLENSRKNTDTNKRLETLTEDEEDDNVIAFPTESITENIPFPENYLTTRVTTPPPSIQVTENSLVQSESLNELLENINENNDVDTTTLTYDFNNDDNNGLSKQNDILSLVDVTRTESPRPFSRPSLTRTRAPTVVRNENVQTSAQTTTRRRPTRISTERTTTLDDEEESTGRPLRPGQTYPPGYRGTARYRTKKTKSGQYNATADSLNLNNYQPIDDNRLRALNLDRANRLNAIPTTSTSNSPSTISRRRPSVTRTETTRSTRVTTTTQESNVDEEETTTEQRVIEAFNRFALKPNERPEKISFSLGTGPRIEFNTPKLDQRNDTSKKIITGPLANSPLVSTRDFKKGHVEEIPLIKPETVTVENHSDKLDLSEIPLNKSDIAKFVPDEELTTRRVRLRPSKIGFAKSYSSGLETESTTVEDDDDESTTTARTTATQRTRFPPRTRVTDEQTKNDIDETTSQRSRPTQTRFTRPRPSSSTSAETEETESTSQRSRQFQSRLLNRNRVVANSLDDSNVEESTTRKAIVKITKINRTTPQKVTVEDVNNLAENENTNQRSRFRPVSSGTFALRTTEEPNDSDENTENPLENDELNEVDETTKSSFDDIDDLTTVDSPVDTTSKRPRVKVIAKKINSFATRQSITSTSKNVENDDDDEVKNEEEISSSSQKPSRRVVTRRRPISQTSTVDNEQTSPRTFVTRRRLIGRTRSRPVVTDTDNADSELSENTETTNIEDNTSEKSVEGGRRRVVVRVKPTPSASDVTESSRRGFSAGRTKVFRRPVSTTEKSEITEDENQEETDRPRFVPLKKLIKVNKKIVETTPARKITKITKKVKTPKALVDQELTEEDFILKPEDLEQDLTSSNVYGDQDEEQQVDISADDESSSETPTKPSFRLPTRQSTANRVTIKKRPAFNARPQTTLTTKTIKDSQSIRAKTVTIRRKFGTTSRTDSSTDEGKKFTLSDKNKKIYKNRRISTSTIAPLITPLTDTTEYDEVDDTTNTSIDIDNDDNNFQRSSSVRPRFSVKGTKTTTTAPPTTLHHVFAIIDEMKNNNNTENNADEVIKKLQKLIEINRVVEVYSKEEKLKLLKNNKLKTVKSSNLIVEKPASLDKFGEISKLTIIKVAKSPENITTTTTTTTSSPREGKELVFDEKLLSEPESSTISLEGLFVKDNNGVVLTQNDTKPLVISLESLDKVVLSKIENSDEETLTTTESSSSPEDTTLVDDENDE
jgi:hypothetical protein